MSYVDGSRDGMTRQEFLATALARLQDGRLVYTVSEGGQLRHSCWLIPKPGHLPVDPFHPVSQPARTAVLADAFTDPSARGRGLQRQGLHWRIQEARSVNAIESIISYVIAANVASRRNLEKVGFVHVGSLHTVRRFGRVWREHVALRPDPPN
jgi:RimJ/RimL family protein N-acetyltransferase